MSRFTDYDFEALAETLATHTAWDSASSISSPVADGGVGPRSGSEGVAPSLSPVTGEKVGMRGSPLTSISNPSASIDSPNTQCLIPDASPESLLHDLADPTLSLADLTHIHRATITMLARVAESAEFRNAKAAYLDLAEIREQLITATAHASALAALTECAANAQNPETRRKSAQTIIAASSPEVQSPSTPLNQNNRVHMAYEI